ncbi:MAG: putative Ig domain-containing protein [Smithellaceae bacterium]
MSFRHGRIYLVLLFSLLIVGGTAQLAHAAATITNPASSPATLPQGQESSLYSYTFTASGTAGGDRWSISAGSLPPGLSLTSNTNTSVVLSGTPTTAGTYTFTIKIKTVTCQCTLTIAQRCLFAGVSNGIISFGSIDPSSTGSIYANVNQQVSFTCASGTAYTITANPASGWTLVSGSNTIPYTLGLAPNGTSSGTAVNLFVAPPSTSASSITPANFQNVPAGSYSNTSAVSVTISYGTGSLTASLASGSATGTVTSTCTIVQTPGTLSFNINPSVTGTTNGTISPDLQIKCTKNITFSVSAASACGGLSQTYPPTCGGYIIPYTFSYSPGFTSGQGFGVPIPMNIGGSVSSTNYENAPPVSYGDLRTFTITY